MAMGGGGQKVAGGRRCDLLIGPVHTRTSLPCAVRSKPGQLLDSFRTALCTGAETHASNKLESPHLQISMHCRHHPDAPSCIARQRPQQSLLRRSCKRLRLLHRPRVQGAGHTALGTAEGALQQGQAGWLRGCRGGGGPRGGDVPHACRVVSARVCSL